MAGKKSYKLPSDVRYRVVGGEAVVLRQNDAEVVVLNEVGSRILDLMAAGRSLQAARRVLLEEFDVAPEELDRDLREFVTELETSNVLESVPNG